MASFKQHSLNGIVGGLLALSSVNLQATPHDYQGERDPLLRAERIEAYHIEKLEDRLARIQSRLDIRPDQMDAWDNWADTVRAQAAEKMTLHEARIIEGRPHPGEIDPAQRIDMKVEKMNQHIAALEELKAPTLALYEVLDEDQQKSANYLLNAGKEGKSPKKHMKKHH